MAKPPSIHPTASTALTAAEESMLNPDNISVTIRNGKRIVEGYNQNGEKVVIETTIMNSSEQSYGFRSQTMTVCDQLSIPERREVAQRLAQEGLPQTEIAKRLGVSQKTISTDLSGG